ncbi:hypothetical protein FOXB_06633 [Fusarium oxysporum f. sp. conglutinans Fo5176]|uniref:Secreted protein n=1 Tax=Fusarium oxysporum (strain Fo5176) TaxID=660025 RepID=F9FJU7_FUSOF|nr:hypothetical protein FOXB_06633 [Fusarium oxysporum f. sp. conglutinans Fo5176]
MNPRNFMAPGAAFTMACVLLVYTRSSIHSARDQANPLTEILETTREWRTCTKTWFIMNVEQISQTYIMKQTPFECLRCTDFAMPRLISPLMPLGKSSSLCPSGTKSP